MKSSQNARAFNFLWNVFTMDVPPNNCRRGNENKDAKAPPFCCFPKTGSLMAFRFEVVKEFSCSFVIVPFSKQVIWVMYRRSLVTTLLQSMVSSSSADCPPIKSFSNAGSNDLGCLRPFAMQGSNFKCKRTAKMPNIPNEFRKYSSIFFAFHLLRSVVNKLLHMFANSEIRIDQFITIGVCSKVRFERWIQEILHYTD